MISNFAGNNIYPFSKLLTIKSVKKELNEQLTDYNIENIKIKNNIFNCSCVNNNGDYIVLKVKYDFIYFLKKTNNKIENISINNELLLSHRTLEKRKRGYIYSIVSKQFKNSKGFKKNYELIDLIEERYVFTINKITTLSSNINISTDDLKNIFYKIRVLEGKTELESKSDFLSKFTTHINYFPTNNYQVEQRVGDNLYPVSTYINNEDISSIYKVSGQNALERIYNLYNGIIDNNNIKDINKIYLGIMSPSAFDLKKLKGISETEDLIIGKSLEKKDNNRYLNEKLDIALLQLNEENSTHQKRNQETVKENEYQNKKILKLIK